MKNSAASIAKAILASWEILLIVMLAATVALCSAHSSYFLSPRTVTGVTGDLSEKAVMVLAMTLIIISAEIDLSVASVLGLSSVSLGLLIARGVPLAPALGICLTLGLVCGLANALFVVRFKLPSLVVTLGTMALFRGLAYVLMRDSAVSTFPVSLTNFGYMNIPGTLIPQPFAVFIVLGIVIWWVLHGSYVGRQIYAIGLSAEAARFSGIPVARIKTALFALSGLFAALAGIIFTARYSSSQPANGDGYELDVITVALLGGVSIFGGRGRLPGVLLALVLVGTIRKGLALADVPNDFDGLAIGCLLIFAVLGPNMIQRLSSAINSKRIRMET